MKKYGVLFFSVCLMLFLLTGTALAEEDPSVKGDWTGDGEDWQYMLPDGMYLEKSWLYDDGRWYYFSSSGYMQTGLRKIGSNYYFFRENGEMATGWAYDADEEQWHYMDEDGAVTKGWLQKGGAWYWFDSKGVMYNRGFRMVDGHKYYFYEDGQMAANQFVGMNYYDENGLRDNRYDMTIQGKRKPTNEERDKITQALSGVPREWIKKFVESGWEFMYYTDKKYFSAPKTDQGIYFVYHKTDKNYKKLKFTNPETLAMAFGEYIAYATGNDKEDNDFMADFYQYLSESSMAQSLPSYFDSDPAMWFGWLIQCYGNTEIRIDMKRNSPELVKNLEKALGLDTAGRKPDSEELMMDEDPGIVSNGNGPANDEELGNEPGPASS
ncbi:N-acetylmuramoyl-L-alanine amidase family protein [uncultured Clostridium sp.]|uniref:N-acetylmuramoyl-L-alanine amidase family protein n=1 Tax=uncultured Clostridium sp. TaxID=59620 RepID=UPI0025CECE29|nr:N-acetylmuramoyl-L-alanine amidase family protein [uncultured Clostridium sp.]